MISGYGPSGPDAGAGGKAALTSSGMPSKVFVVERGLVLPQKRTPSDWTEQLTSPPKTLAMLAPADGTTTSAAIATINPASFRMRLLPRTGPPPWVRRAGDHFTASAARDLDRCRLRQPGRAPAAVPVDEA